MKPHAILAVCTASLLLAACDSTTGGTATTASGTASSQSATTTTSTALPGVSPPTTAAPNPRVTGTSFDGCASVTDAEAASWQLDPASKQDTKDSATVGAENVRGCAWDGEKWQVRVYAASGSIAQWEGPNPDFDRKEQMQFGSRRGWLAHSAGHVPDCTAVVASQRGIAGVQVIPFRALQLANADVCPITQQIMTTIAPRIP